MAISYSLKEIVLIEMKRYLEYVTTGATGRARLGKSIMRHAMPSMQGAGRSAGGMGVGVR